MFASEEESPRFPHRYIEFVKSHDGHAIRDRFARCPDLLLKEFCSYLADFLRLGYWMWSLWRMKQVGLNMSTGLDGLPLEVYLRMSHIFAPILTDMFNHWVALGSIPGSITKGVIILLKKGGKHVWED